MNPCEDPSPASTDTLASRHQKKKMEEEFCLATWNASNAWKLYQKSSWNEIGKVVEHKKGTSKNHRNKKEEETTEMLDARPCVPVCMQTIFI